VERNPQSPAPMSLTATRRFRLGWGLAVLLPFMSSSQPAAPTEYEIKAVWLLNFARFVEWPADAFSSPQAPLVVCVVGRDPFGSALEKTLAGKTIGGRPLAIRRLPADRDLAGCHVIFFSNSEKKKHRELIAKLRGTPVLTVGESDGFLNDEGLIQFVRREDTIRFAVNLESARSTRLKVSANLVKVAVLVKGKYE
jgi:hypothetical protein